MTIPSDIAIWLQRNCMRAIPTVEYLELLRDKMMLQRQVRVLEAELEAKS